MNVRIAVFCSLLVSLVCGISTSVLAEEPLNTLSDAVAECGHNECICECTIWGGGHDPRLFNKETKTKFFSVAVSEMTPEACVKNNARGCLGYQGGAPESTVRGHFSDCEVTWVPDARRCGLTPDQLATLLGILLSM